MRIGRIIRQGDVLFADGSHVSSGGVVLARSSSDDYVRFRVPDTQCPSLPQPDQPLDSGVADEAEPERWLYAGQYINVPGWVFSIVPGAALDWVRPSYTCYDGDFSVELQLGWSDVGLPRVPSAQAANFDLFVFEIAQGGGYGICLGGLGGQAAMQPWQLGVYAYVNGVLGAQLGWLTAGHAGRFRISRAGGVVSVTYVENNESAQVLTNSSGQVPLRLRRDFTLPEFGVRVPNVVVSRISTLMGAPASVTVTTPVVDKGSSVRAQVKRYPEVGTLEWRASDTPFGQNDPTPAWDNPSGEYRYWQARVMWGDSSQLLERIEFLVRGFKHIVTIPSVGRNVELWHAEGAFPRGGSKGVVSLERVPTEEGWELESQRLITVDR